MPELNNEFKIIIYQKSIIKPIILTIDKDQVDESKKEILNHSNNNELSSITTPNEKLIYQPFNLQAVLITSYQKINKSSLDKVTIYLNGSTKPIILSGGDEFNSDEIFNNFLSLLKSNFISTIQTDLDWLLIKPSEINGILLSHTDRKSND